MVFTYIKVFSGFILSFDQNCLVYDEKNNNFNLTVAPVLFFLFFFCLEGPKLLQLQNLGGCFVVFFLLKGPKSQLRES